MLPLGLELLYARVELGDFVGKVFYDLALGVHLLFLLLELPAVLEQGLVLLLVLEVLLGQCQLLGLDFLFELVDLVVHDLVPPLGLSYFVLRLRQVFGVGVARRSH